MSGAFPEEEEEEWRPFPSSLFNTETQEKIRAQQLRKEDKVKKMKVRKVKKVIRQVRTQQTRDRVRAIDACVSKVEFSGLSRTKDGMVENLVQDLFQTKTYGEVLEQTRVAHTRLKQLGCFQTVNITIDTDKTDDRFLAVNVKVRELDPWNGWVEPMTSDLGDTKIVGVAKLQNIFGRGECLRLRSSQSWCQNRVDELFYFKGTEKKMAFAGVSRQNEAIPWQQLRKNQYDGLLGFLFEPFPWLVQEVGLNASIRHLYPSRHSTDLPFNSRIDCGYSLKSSLTHQLTVDTRDDRATPSKGIFLRLFHEVTGPVGNVSFVKQVLDLRAYVPLAKHWTVSLSSSLGSLSDTLGSFNGINSSDFLGFNHSLNCRGWNNKKISSSEYGRPFKNQILFSSSLKLCFPVPLLRGTKSWIIQTFQPHVFVDYGFMGKADNLRLKTILDRGQISSDATSLSYGLGVAIKLGQVGRAELNYCLPVRHLSTHALPGLQFGMGINFL